MNNDTNTTSGAFADTAKDFGNTASSTGRDFKAAATNAADDLKSRSTDLRDSAGSLVDDLKAKASDHAGDARSVVSSMAEQARSRIGEIVDQQKTLGADKLSGLSRAAQNAAGELDEQNPHVARLVRDAATSVDRFAGDLRSSDLSDIVDSVSQFARKQPIAFFAGSVLAGLVLARFLKSEPSSVRAPHYGAPDRS